MINNSLREIRSRTKEQRLELLYRAKILDENGNYHPDFFSEETIRKDKERKQIKEYPMVTVDFTYDYDSKFLPIYREFFESEFTGREWCDRIKYIPDSVLEFRLRKRLLERKLDDKHMPMMVISLDGDPVGLSFPRNTFTEEEKFHFEVEDFQYYKIGSIIIKRQYRTQGIAYDACKLFMNRYNPITYHVDTKNIASIRLAEKLGLSISHITTMNSVQYLIFK